MKRMIDIMLALGAGLVFLVPMICVAIAVKLTSHGPVLYWSDRVGRDNIIFSMPKFRSMKVGTPVVATHQLTQGKSHLTSIGGILRKTSLDELPQLWCILTGAMSVVGPRPALFNQDDLVELRSKAGVHKLRPGLTGWAQVNGRDEISIPDKVALDDHYRAHQSLLLDVQIIWMTIIKVIGGSDVSH
jgi:O-antigen biosynthesis protein WbqP